jgi:hypothetical protein
MGDNLNDSHDDFKIHNTIHKQENNTYKPFTLWIDMFSKNCFKNCRYIELI